MFNMDSNGWHFGLLVWFGLAAPQPPGVILQASAGDGKGLMDRAIGIAGRGRIVVDRDPLPRHTDFDVDGIGVAVPVPVIRPVDDDSAKRDPVEELPKLRDLFGDAAGQGRGMSDAVIADLKRGGTHGSGLMLQFSADPQSWLRVSCGLVPGYFPFSSGLAGAGLVGGTAK
ncbi:MAG TPA: hypothetical protein VHC86_12810 [Opitutaceae bacterium]|nr:hypothetical protein [Opitutaceae bacterium]